MTGAPIDVLLLTDQDGNYYLLSRELLDRVRVPADEAPEVKRLVEDADTSGFSALGNLPSLTPLGTFAVQRKAGKEQQEYLIVKFQDLLVSSY